MMRLLVTLALSLSGWPGERNTAVDRPVPSGGSPRKIVTWPYLRAAARMNKNPGIEKLLKARSQLIPTVRSANSMTGECTRDPWNDPCDPVASASSDLASSRFDIPFRFNGQVLTLSMAVVYEERSRKVLSASSVIYGDTGGIVWNNYATAAADYSDDELTVIINLSYTAPTSENAYTPSRSGSGELDGKAVVITASAGAKSEPQASYQSGVLYGKFDVKRQTQSGRGFIQINGINGPRYEYVVKPG